MPHQPHTVIKYFGSKPAFSLNIKIDGRKLMPIDFIFSQKPMGQYRVLRPIVSESAVKAMHNQ